jgi:hypothetical protein
MAIMPRPLPWRQGAILLAACALGAHGQVLDVQMTDDGSFGFGVTFDGAPWLRGADVMVDGAFASTGGLVLVCVANESSADPLGAYEATTHAWALATDDDGADDDVVMRTSVRRYADAPSVLVFEQSFPRELARATPPCEDEALSARTLFPAFARAAPADGPELSCFA